MPMYQAKFSDNKESSHWKIVPMTEKHPIHEELKEIFRQALRASGKKRDRLRREGIRKMVAAPKHCFWPVCQGLSLESLDQERYIKASDIAWDYIERKIYGNIRGNATAEEKAYDPDKGNASPLKLWNISCQKEYKNLHKKPQHITPENPIDSRTGEPLNIEDVAQPEDEPSWLQLILQEIETDPTGDLKKSFVRQTPPPPITAQAALFVIYDRTSRGEKWTNKILAEHFNISPGVMNSAWTRTLKPLLQKMGDRLLQKMGDRLRNQI